MTTSLPAFLSLRCQNPLCIYFRACTHTHAHAQPLAKLSGSDFSLRISHQIWTAGWKCWKWICKPKRKKGANKKLNSSNTWFVFWENFTKPTTYLFRLRSFFFSKIILCPLWLFSIAVSSPTKVGGEGRWWKVKETQAVGVKPICWVSLTLLLSLDYRNMDTLLEHCCTWRTAQCGTRRCTQTFLFLQVGNIKHPFLRRLYYLLFMGLSIRCLDLSHATLLNCLWLEFELNTFAS